MPRRRGAGGAARETGRSEGPMPRTTRSPGPPAQARPARARPPGRAVRRGALGAVLAAALLPGAACHEQLVDRADRDVAALIAARQQAALGQEAPPDITRPADWPRAGRGAYETNPRPARAPVPPEFTTPASGPAPAPAGGPPPATAAAEAAGAAPSAEPGLGPMAASAPAGAPATGPARRRERVLTLTDALAYAQRHRREYQTAKEDLYLAALALTLERHLWTPIFAAELKTVYGNYGEARDFDQAMRFVADLSVAQRLPYGGEFTAGMISTLIRDVGKTITAAEGSVASLGLNVPLLRGAGHVARETLIQLERELTYAVRVFERFRRQQLITVAQDYFTLLREKQSVLDSLESYKRFRYDFERAQELERAEERQTSQLDVRRAESAMLSAANALEDARERFRFQADQFKLQIGMPVDEPLELEDLEDIETIERQVSGGSYPALARPQAVDDIDLAVEVALQRRFDLLTLADRIDDARRGVAVSRNALLPDLDWSGSVTFDTDPEHYNAGALAYDRANWRTELLLSLPVERTAERNALRRALIDVRQAQRSYEDLAERIRVEVRRAVNRVYLQERSLEIQSRNVQVADLRREYARYQFEEGEISNRDLVEAENEWRSARDRLNLAKTDRWNALLQFRLATETLAIAEDGTQRPDPAAGP